MRPIDDGYTRWAVIPGIRQKRDLAFEYRPMLVRDRRVLIERIARYLEAGPAGSLVARDLLGEAIALRVLSWSLTDKSGGVVPVSREAVARLGDRLLLPMAGAVLGSEDDAALARREAEDARNLAEGVRLLLAHPEVAHRDCEDCQRHVYDEALGKPATYRGKPVLRPKGTLPPCRLPHVGCPRGTPEHSRALSAENRRAWRFDRECRAVGCFPEDPIVRRNAAVIRAAETSLAPASAPVLHQPEKCG